MKVPKNFGKRSTANDEKLQPKTRYFLTFEGEKTEYQYFKGVVDHQHELGINEIIEIIPLSRHYIEKSWSNPEKACQLFVKDLRER
ncbi:MAG: RloB domain-containing protein, partial [Paludibacter sp.]|nr:RloB domain-containing protein [Paludibacter sp.]